jgi:hypothetical protein
MRQNDDYWGRNMIKKTAFEERIIRKRYSSRQLASAAMPQTPPARR